MTLTKAMLFVVAAALCGPASAATSILFVGNTFTAGELSAVRNYRPATVTDLNGTGLGGVPALFKHFADQAGLDYVVSLEVSSGYGLAEHYNNKLGLIDQAWDKVVLQSTSTLDFSDPGNPASLVTHTGLLADVVHGRNPDVDVYLTATWSRADLTYIAPSPWLGQSIYAMAEDVQAGYELAAAASPHVTDVVEVGAAWNLAIGSGLADGNPYDGLTPGQMNLWAADAYHASNRGYYLEALMLFGSITGLDPRSLGSGEAAADALGITAWEAVALQDIAYQTLAPSAGAAAPEPASWAMMLAGFGLIGGAIRRRDRQTDEAVAA